MATAHLNGIDVYFERHGVDGGPRVLVCNGSGGTIAAAGPLIQRLAPACDVLIHDQRCLGRTTVTDDVPTMADYAADAAALLDHVGWDTASVVGVSFGGMVAQEFAVTWPERVTRLVLACTSPGGAGGSSYPLHTLVDMDAEEQSAIRLRLADSRYTPEFLAAHPFDRMLVDLAEQGRAAARTDEQRRGELFQLEARAGHDVWDRLPRITCPTMVACGEYDVLAPPANSDAIASRLPAATLRRYQGGHAFLWQDRQAWPDVVEFLTAPA